MKLHDDYAVVELLRASELAALDYDKLGVPIALRGYPVARVVMWGSYMRSQWEPEAYTLADQWDAMASPPKPTMLLILKERVKGTTDQFLIHYSSVLGSVIEHV